MVAQELGNSLRTFDEAADLIEETLDDENDADEHLTSLARADC